MDASYGIYLFRLDLCTHHELQIYLAEGMHINIIYYVHILAIGEQKDRWCINIYQQFDGALTLKCKYYINYS